MPPEGVDSNHELTTIQRNHRNVKIIRAKLRGQTTAVVALKFGVDPTTVTRIMRQYRETNPTLRTQDPIDIVDEMLLGYQADLEQLAEIGENAKNDSARVGAVNSRMVARDRIIALLQSTGVLPNDLGQLRVEIDVRYIAQTLVQIFSRHQIDEGIQREILEALRGQQQQLPPPVVES